MEEVWSVCVMGIFVLCRIMVFICTRGQVGEDNLGRVLYCVSLTQCRVL